MDEEKKYLGIDWGEARIGLAFGDSLLATATPYKTVKNLSEVLEVVKKEQIDCLVLGDPLKLGEKSGSKKPDKFYDKFKSFKKKLEELSEREVFLYDERLSSRGADSLSGGKKEKASRDELAAMLILQSYLDSEKKDARHF